MECCVWAAIKRGKHVLVHKPYFKQADRRKESGRDGPQSSKVITHLIPWDSNGSMDTVMAWINAGAIGTLAEVHNWD
ncbi:MAG: hypothetical protein WDO71_21695 [Bacteroidota bacterium]